MPSIIPKGRRGEAPRSLDELRENPGGLYGRRDLAELNAVKSHDGVRRLIDTGRLPEPYHIGNVELWEARDILKMIEASRQQQRAGGEMKTGRCPDRPVELGTEAAA
jgi:hypothetical protein